MTEWGQCHYCHLPLPRWRKSEPDSPAYCCYGCQFAARITQSQGAQGEAAWMLVRLGLAMFLSMSVTVMSLFLYGEHWAAGSTTTTLGSSESTLAGLLRYASMLLSTPVLYLLGVPIFLNAVEQWRKGSASTDALVVIAVTAAMVFSYNSTLHDQGATYYETACMVLVLMTLGRWLEATGRIKASAAVQALQRHLPEEVEVSCQGEDRRVKPDQIQIGDIFKVYTGQTFAADGTVQSGRAEVDERTVTGESVAKSVGPGDTVRAGAINIDGFLTIAAMEVGEHSTLGKMIQLLGEAQLAKGSYERLADRLVRWFLPFILVAALVAAMLGWQRSGLDQAILSAMATLLIACPCALGIATPLAAWMIMGRAAESGAVFKTGQAVEKLASVKAFCFDKTGTLTTGTSRVREVVTSGVNGTSSEDIITIAGTLACASSHAASQGIAEFALKATAHTPRLGQSIQSLPGRGIASILDGRRVVLGNRRLMDEADLQMPATLSNAVEDFAARGAACTFVGWDGHVHGVFAMQEELRPEARQAVDDLQQLGCSVEVLTGDDAARGSAIELALGVPTAAQLLPENKVERVRQSQQESGPTAMVGDGINDAAALATADVGIAMGCGADVTRESADLCLLGNDLRKIPELAEQCRRAVRIMRLNLFWAFAYNAVGVALAIAGVLTPMLAAGAMVLSSVFVIGNSLRLGPPGLEGGA